MQNCFAAKGSASLPRSRKATSFPGGQWAGSERELRETLELDLEQVIITSARTREGIADLRAAIDAFGEGCRCMTLRRYAVRVLHTAVGAIVWLSSWRRDNVSSAQDTLPVGYGTLKRDDIVVRFATDQLEIQVLPLAEQVIRLLAPDTYRSLAQLLKSKGRDLADAAQRASVDRPTLIMVTFFGLLPQARFSPRT